MWIQFTNTDASGRVPTDRLAVTVDGDRYEVDVASTGRAQVPRAVGHYLVASDDHQVVPCHDDADVTPDDNVADALAAV